MSSHNQETEGESIWLSPEASQALLNEYQNFLDDYQKRLKQQIDQNRDEVSVQKLCQEMVNENHIWVAKLQSCDPDTSEAFFIEREAREKEERLKRVVSPEVKEAIIAMDALTERIIEKNKKQNARKAWKRSLMENSQRQIELLENLKEQMAVIIQFQKDATIRELYSKVVFG
jgi:hypothetical protein